MKKIFPKTAFTLIELIVSLMLLSVVVLGIFSINMVLSNNNQDYGQRYLVKSATQTTLNQILGNAALAVGNGVADPNSTPTASWPETGILIGSATNGTGLGNGHANNANSFCIHQDFPSNTLSNSAPNNPATVPPGYTGSRWLCYTYYGSGAATTATSAPYQIWKCAMPYIETAAYRGAGSCDSSDGNITAAAQFTGTAYSIFDLGAANNTAPAFAATNGTGTLTFSITIQNCLNDSLSTCSATGTSTDPVNNPEVQLTGSVQTPQESN